MPIFMDSRLSNGVGVGARAGAGAGLGVGAPPPGHSSVPFCHFKHPSRSLRTHVRSLERNALGRREGQDFSSLRSSK